MKSLVVYDSLYGNTEKIAKSISKVLAEAGVNETVYVENYTSEMLKDVNLLIVGTPTHGFNTSDKTKKFLRKIKADGLKGIKVVAFDTRFPQEEIDKIKILKPLAKIFGFAAKPLSKQLIARGGELIIDPEGFFVSGKEGPLVDGEEARAEKWANEIQNRL